MYLFVEYVIKRCEDDEEYKREVIRVLDRVETAARNAKLKLGE